MADRLLGHFAFVPMTRRAGRWLLLGRRVEGQVYELEGGDTPPGEREPIGPAEARDPELLERQLAALLKQSEEDANRHLVLRGRIPPKLILERERIRLRLEQLRKGR